MFPSPYRFAPTRLSVALIIIALGSAACRPPASPVTPRPLGASVPAYRPSGRDSAIRVAPAQSASDSITLQDAIRLTLLHSPELVAFNWETRAGEARALGARRPPNPSLDYLAEDVGAKAGSGSAPTSASAVQRQTTIQLSQLVEIGGKRFFRARVAARERDVAEWNYEAARIDALTGAAHAFVDVLAAQQLVALAQRTDTLVAQVEQSVGARVAAGVVSPIEETRAQVARATARVDLDRAQRALTAARTRLAASWGQTRATFGGANGTLETIHDAPPLERLQQSLRQNPELARWASQVAARKAALSLEQARRIPDVQLIGGYRRFDDLNVSAYVLGASLPIPLFSQNRHGVAEARSLANKAEAEERAAQARIAAALSTAHGAMAGARSDMLALREIILPKSRETFELMTEGYRLGRFSFLDVLDAQRTLIASEERYLRALSDYHKSVAEVERLIGAPLGDATPR